MTLHIGADLLQEVEHYLEAGYPEEVAGLLLGEVNGQERQAIELVQTINSFDPAARARRYQMDPKDMLAAEEQAERLGLDVIGVFHSHPDHPSRPSDFDLRWALPWYDYLITRVTREGAGDSRAWRLAEDRSQFVEVPIVVDAVQTEANS